MIWRRTRLLLSAFLVFFLLTPTAEAVSERTGAAFFIQDDAKLLTASEEAELARLGQELEQYTTAQVVLKTVPDLKGQDLSTYANETFRAQGIGQEGKDNGVMVIVAPNEKSRNFRIEVGYKLEGVLTDITAGRILDQYAVPYRDEGDYGKAASETYKAVISVVSKEQSLESQDSPKANAEEGLSLWVKIVIGAGLVLLLFLDMKFTGGMFFFAIINILSAVMRGGGGGGGGSRGGGGSSGGGGAER
ncbi:YgcG family protein [Exiguobacterium sp. S90]|uniref:TPM domain-containing protein n=1 Tax=Exiguobacterium sp. S90 TaxID=1221231 RepID=UPI001BEA1F9A|nr:TPM domain-containing protein [Exiguobacterium sp. S90]